MEAKDFTVPNDVNKKVSEKMEQIIKFFKGELGHLRTGRASTSILDGVKVDYYGTLTPINQVATVNVPSHDLIVISPWDKSILKQIEKAILEANLGLNPGDDGDSIKIPIPPLTEETRKSLVKKAHGIAESNRVKIRSLRHDGRNILKKMEKESGISEDDIEKAMKHIQEITDDFIKEIDSILSKKEKELLTI